MIKNIKLFCLSNSHCKGKTLTHNEIDLDVHQFKEGKIRCEIEGPSRADIRYINNNDAHVKITYKVSIPGDYTIHIKFNTFFVMGAPFHVKGKTSFRCLPQL